MQLMQQKKCVEFGSSVYHHHNNSTNDCDVIKDEANRHINSINTNISANANSLPSTHHIDQKTIQLSSDTYFNYSTISNNNNNSNNKVTTDRVEDGYDGASETGRCETDGVDEFESENDTIIVANQESNIMNINSSHEWDQPMEMQISSKECKDISTASTTNSNNMTCISSQEFEGATAMGGKKRRVRSRKYIERPSISSFDCI